MRPERRHPRPAAALHVPTFSSLGVPPALTAALAAAGIDAPFPIQAAVLPDALAGVDILGRGRTGSGKTLGFSIPLVARLTGGRTQAGHPRGLVLVPTRELATQVHNVLRPLAGAVGLRVATIFGGMSQRPQVAALRGRVDIIVACPGRLADLIDQRHCDLGDVEVSVVDEADHMADLGFLPVVRRLLDATPRDGQRMLFSATLDHDVDVLVRRFLTRPAEHAIDPPEAPVPVVHHLLTVAPGERTDVVAALVGGGHRSLIFTRTRSGARRLARQLSAADIPAVELHGDLSQSNRTRNLAQFASGAVRVLVATDIAARGIHVDGVELVIHADPPAEHKAYLHRSGRTGRAGASGIVITLQTPAQTGDVRTLMRKALVVPIVAAVGPTSELLAEIAGEPGEPPAARLSPPRPSGAARSAGRQSPAARSAGRQSPGARPAETRSTAAESAPAHRPANRASRPAKRGATARTASRRRRGSR
jgi:superfamily II DNA/RNA helicase